MSRLEGQPRDWLLIAERSVAEGNHLSVLGEAHRFMLVLVCHLLTRSVE